LRTDKFRPVEQSFAVEEQQPILRPALRREEKQRQLMEWSPRRFAASSSSNSASSATASRSCAAISGTRRGAITLISLGLFLLIHVRPGSDVTENPSLKERPFSPLSGV
jgi:hypothetical protein